jgi:hypothetical protein
MPAHYWLNFADRCWKALTRVASFLSLLDESKEAAGSVSGLIWHQLDLFFFFFPGQGFGYFESRVGPGCGWGLVYPWDGLVYP